MPININEALKFIINDYHPMVEIIEKKLLEIDDYEEQIEFLKGKEIDYLLYVSLNPDLMEASGIVTKDHSKKIGLDRWIELRINKIELLIKNDQRIINSKSKRTLMSFKWINNPDIELPKLFIQIKDNYKLISTETTLEQFCLIFKGVYIEDIIPIKWHSDNLSELIYFNQQLLKRTQKEWRIYQRLKACFVKPDGTNFKGAFKALNQNVYINLAESKQKNIDSLMDSIK